MSAQPMGRSSNFESLDLRRSLADTQLRMQTRLISATAVRQNSPAPSEVSVLPAQSDRGQGARNSPSISLPNIDITTLASYKRRRIEQITVPYQKANSEVVWRAPSEMPRELTDALMRSIYNELDDTAKSAVWASYGNESDNCVLTQCISRGSSQSVWSKQIHHLGFVNLQEQYARNYDEAPIKTGKGNAMHDLASRFSNIRTLNVKFDHKLLRDLKQFLGETESGREDFESRVGLTRFLENPKLEHLKLECH